jgi:hypothetical protein
MTWRRVLLWLCIGASSACTPADQRPAAKAAKAQNQVAVSAPRVSPRPTDWQRAFGVVASMHDTLCLRIKRVAIPSGTKVLLVSGDTTRASLTATVSGILPSGCRRDNAEPEEYSYRLSASNAEQGVLWIAVIDSANSYQPGPAIDIDADGKPEQFRECASSEGIHFTVWTGAPLTGIRRWHYYYYLGYDVVPTCTDSEGAAP